MQRIQTLLVLVFITVFGSAAFAFAEDMTDEEVADASFQLAFGSADVARVALDDLVERGDTDIIPTLVLAMRYRSDPEPSIRAMSAMTGDFMRGWRDAMLWQEAHPEVRPHPSYRDVKIKMFEQIDHNFLRFLGGDLSRPENLDIRLEEIVWGGVVVDGIPSLDNPKLIAARDADYLGDDDLVFGVAINGDVRAYPLRIMGWHEMFNDTIGGVPVALAYCTLCGAGILFETEVDGRDEPLVFGSSGFLYRSNKLMFDRETNSLWNQFTGEPVGGPLRGSGIELKIRPVTITSWKDWRSSHPDTKVLSLNTGFRRDYGPGVVYRDYFASPDLMFPTIVGDENVVRRKDYVFGIREFGAAKAWPVETFRDRSVLNDAIGGRNLVLVGDAATRTVRAYERGDAVFSDRLDGDRLEGPGGAWTLTEDSLVGPDGIALARVPGHISYWFAWDGYLGVESELYAGG